MTGMVGVWKAPLRKYLYFLCFTSRKYNGIYNILNNRKQLNFKVLRCSKMSMNAGEVMELVCDDTHRLVTMGDQFLPNLVRQSSKVIIYLIWLLCFVGWKFLPGLGVFTILALFRLSMTKMDIKFRRKASQLAEKRLGYLREVLTIIHSVKLNCLEHIYEEKIQRTRW